LNCDFFWPTVTPREFSQATTAWTLLSIYNRFLAFGFFDYFHILKPTLL